MDNSKILGQLIKTKKGDYQKIALIISFNWANKTITVRTTEGFEFEVSQDDKGRWNEA